MTRKLFALIASVLSIAILFCGCVIYETSSEASAPVTDTTVTSESTLISSVPSEAEQTNEDETGHESESALDTSEATEESAEETDIDINGCFTNVDDVSLYIHTYGTLPSNFMAKNEARALGWEGGSLEPFAPGMCIGGDYFGNYEGLLPTASGREYHECDIDTLGASSRGAKRIIYSNDGLIYYTSDHYESFTLLYGEK